MKNAAACLAAAFSFLTTNAVAQDTNFSQRPGFAEYFAANPPSAELPSPADRRLLEKFRPRLFVGPDQEGPIRFYEDYIAQGRLLDRDGNLLSDTVTPALLNTHGSDPYVVFEHRSSDTPIRPVLYGRVDRESFSMGGRMRNFTFLSWTAVFRVSGIAAGISWVKGTVLGTLGDLDDWHQLDHYTAVTLALNEAEKPVALMLQQHNYRRTYIFGIDLPWPEDGRVPVDVALRSNELYPHLPDRTVRRAASFMSPETAHYLITGEDPPFRSADDITDPAREIAYELGFLTPSDAFYTFKGFLGEKRLMPGRSGPPGADYNTLSAMKPLHRQMVFFHWRKDDPDYVNWIQEPDRGLNKLSNRFAKLLSRIENP